MTYCTEYGLEMPDNFPIAALDTFMALARQRFLEPNIPAGEEWAEFAGGVNIMGWRFRAAAEAWTSYRVLGEGSQDEVYQREQQLFGMFASGVSSIEGATYAIAAAANHPQVLAMAFGAWRQRHSDPAHLSDWLTAYPVASDLKAALEALESAPEWTRWMELRNRMSHRGNLPRRTFFSVGSTPPVARPINYAATSSTTEIDAGFEDFEALLDWLATTLRSLLVAASTLLRNTPVP